VAHLTERALLERLGARAARRPGVAVGIGDDAAVLEGEPAEVVTQDLLVEGVHFRRPATSPADLGHKALAVSLSDVAAMGAEPVAAVVGLGLPADGGPSLEDIEALYGAMEALAARSGCTVAGGDTTEAPVLLLAVTVVGRVPAGGRVALRSGARPGDILCVTGALGASAAGLMLLEDPALAARVPEAEDLRRAHLRPEPRLAAGRALAAGGATALIDVSDGLALDALRLATASGGAAALDLERVPLAPGVAAVAVAAGREPDVLAATGGEDYELLAAVPEAALAALRAALDVPLSPVGRVIAGLAGVRLLRDGQEIRPARLGWEHGVGR
jgi:thiamine-monophosphate kinase